MTDTPNEQAPATRSEWLALIREAVRLEIEERARPLVMPPAASLQNFHSEWTIPGSIFAPQPPSEG